ncbi:putative transmembrane protein [Gardnerella vaginalis 6119V5]|uniref:DUF3159 domain-containing protein n=1 Tax=Gardnerella vaginalis TaxID=2702 RepID=UPI00026347DE|nr:DUF3159 domain-containing protein [Gardnerella vaginalis]EIK87684.1 putative transmembrane protein [Gardnerella vaginalis 6119V5]
MKKNNAYGKKSSGLASLASIDSDGRNFSVIDSIGGIRGIIESMLPGLLFVICFVITRNVQTTVIVAAVIAVLQVVIRLIQRQSLMGAISGLVSIAICLIWVWTSHQARDYYMMGFITNAVYGVLLAISLIARVPALGLVIESIRKMPTENFGAWLREWLDYKPLKRAYMYVTGLWIAVFVLRLVLQVPLYLTNHVVWLGTVRLLMGLPFWALAIWVSYLIIATPFMRLHHKNREVEHSEVEQSDEKQSDLNSSKKIQ